MKPGFVAAPPHFSTISPHPMNQSVVGGIASRPSANPATFFYLTEPVATQTTQITTERITGKFKIKISK